MKGGLRTQGPWGVVAPVFVALAGAPSAACQSVTPEPAGRAASAAAARATTPDPSSSAPSPSLPSSPIAASGPAVDVDPSFRSPAPERLVAIGDLHGDLAAARRALRLAGAVDAQDRWIGGKLVVVQTGDEIDRGDDDRAIIELFDRLADSAKASGGRVIALNGNHEAMNVSGDFRYVTPGGFAAFADVDPSKVSAAVLAGFPLEARPRLAAFFPGGPTARRLAQRDVIAMVGDTVFVHGGVTEAVVRYGVGRLNREARRWMNGDGAPPALLSDPEGPVWTRRYSDDEAPLDCKGLVTTLAALGARRMAVGHTPHKDGITPACQDGVWRIDTGLAHHYGGPTEVLEIRGDRVTVLRER